MMKKLMLYMFTLSAGALLFGCGSESAGETEVYAVSDEAELSFLWWGGKGREEKTKAALAHYTELNPKVSIDAKSVAWGDYWTTLDATSPDLMQMDYAYLANYANSNLLLDLSPYVEGGVLDVSGIDASVLEAGKVNGKLYAICGGVNAPALLFNQTLIDELGMAVPDQMSANEFISLSREIYEKSGVHTDLPISGSNNRLPYLLRGAGITDPIDDNGFTFDDVSLLEKYFSLYEAGGQEGWAVSAGTYATKNGTGAENSYIISYDNENARAWNGFYWSNQMEAMVNAAPEGIEIGITTWPSDNPAASDYLKPSLFYSISASTKSPEAAVHLLNYMANAKSAYTYLVDDRGIPASSDVAESIVSLESVTGVQVYNFIEYVVTPNSATLSPLSPVGADDVYSYADSLLVEVLSGNMDAHTAAQELYDEAKMIMKNNS